MGDSSTDDDRQSRIAELEKQIAEREREFSVLMQIAQTVASTLELEPLLSIILDQLKALIAYDSAGIVLIEKDVVRFFDYRGPLPRDLVSSWRFSPANPGYQWATYGSHARIVADMKNDPEVGPVYYDSLGEHAKYFQDVRSYMSVPLIARNQIIGFLRLSHSTPNFFTPQHARLAEAVAGHAAIAIENARLLKSEHDRLEEVQRRHLVAESLRGILAVLNSNKPSDQILDYILEQGCRLLETDTAVLYLLDPESNMLFPRAARNVPPHIYQQLEIPVGQGMVGQTVLRQQPVVITDFEMLPMPEDANGERARLVAWAKENFVAILGVPLVIKDQPYGGISLHFRELNRPLTPDAIVLARTFADQAALAIENARLYSQVSELASLEERQRLARELHDSVSQALYGIQLGALTARQVMKNDLPPSEMCAALAEPLDYVVSLAEAGLAEMRALIFELRPESLKMEGLVSALNRQANAMRVRHHLQVDLETGEEPDVPFEVKEALFRIAQEALHNIVKHACAKQVMIQLSSNDAFVELRIGDDGIGFDTTGTFPGHLGLRSMRERAVRIDGTLEITSAPDHGTQICVRVPHPIK